MWIYTYLATVSVLVGTLFALLPAHAEPTVAPLHTDQGQDHSAFLGNDVCAGCHQEAQQAWSHSHHDLAMQTATPETVLGDFTGAQFTYGSVTSRFFTNENRFYVETDNAKGEMAVFEVAYTFGVDPLQQYLLQLPDGRLQALSIAWDSRPKDLGGQRWYHLYADSPAIIDANNALHWTGPYQNWNSQCAECHSTNVIKGYDPQSKTFQTTFAQIDVGCEACHGAGADHVTAARGGNLSDLPNAGFAVNLTARGQWVSAPNKNTAARSQPLANTQQIDTCGRCHARRTPLADYQHGRELLDTHRLAELRIPFYWPDGQIREEDYVYGSFIQSKMHQRGVVCSNCHDPHSGKLQEQGNALCSQCHNPTFYDNPKHTRHGKDSLGSQCVECHMPSQVYMGVDARRDHSLRIPRPDISMLTGSPNACTQCHTNQTASWALDTFYRWGIELHDVNKHRGNVFHSAEQGDFRAITELKNIILDPAQAPIIRATGISLYSQMTSRDFLPVIKSALSANSALIRTSAVNALQNTPATLRFDLLKDLIDDPVLTVRLAVAEQLADISCASIAQCEPEHLKKLFTEYITVQRKHLDMPAVLSELATFYTARGEQQQAKSLLEEALRIDPSYQAAIVNLADILRLENQDTAAESLLLAHLDTPDAAPIYYALGLLKIRDKEPLKALDYLKKAAQQAPDNALFTYVYAIALSDHGKNTEALALLQTWHRKRTGNPDVLMLLIKLLEAQGDHNAAKPYRVELSEIQRIRAEN